MASEGFPPMGKIRARELQQASLPWLCAAFTTEDSHSLHQHWLNSANRATESPHHPSSSLAQELCCGWHLAPGTLVAAVSGSLDLRMPQNLAIHKAKLLLLWALPLSPNQGFDLPYKGYYSVSCLPCPTLGLYHATTRAMAALLVFHSQDPAAALTCHKWGCVTALYPATGSQVVALTSHNLGCNTTALHPTPGS